MSSFSSMYKKAFNEILKPQGYCIWKSVFYKEVNNNICFFVYGKKVVHSQVSSTIEVCVDATPYCVDLKSNKYEPQESATGLFDILKILNPGITTEKNLPEYFITRLMANSEEAALNSLSNLCKDMENLILPYLHKFTDLEYYFDELQKIWGLYECNKKSYNNYFSYGLSLKLRKYNNAIPYVEYWLLWHDNITRRGKADLEELNKGNVMAVFNGSTEEYNVPTEKFVSKILKRQPDFIESQIKAAKKMIADSENETSKLQIIKSALLAKDHDYLDGIVQEIEDSSRNYIRQMVGQ